METQTSALVLRLPEVYARVAPGTALREVPQAVSLTAAWRQSVHQGKSSDAARLRLMLESMTDEETTWQDAEWR